MKRMTTALALLALTACSPPQQNSAEAPIGPPSPAESTAAQEAGCTAQSSRDWSAVGSQYYVIEAEARGPNCREAVATMRIKSRDRVVLFTRDYPVAQVPLAFNPTDDETGLRSDLEGWTQNTADPETGVFLPAWPAGAAKPPGFAPVVSRGQYESARGDGGPLFCFPDGGESNACVAMNGDHATLLGSLTPEHP